MITKFQKKKSDRTVLSVHTKKSTSARLDSLAVSLKQTKSTLANEALESFLDHQEWVFTEIEKGLADIHAGRVISQKDMKIWSTGLTKVKK